MLRNRYRQVLLATSLLFLLFFLLMRCGEKGSPTCDEVEGEVVSNPESEFRATLLRTGNSLEGYKDAETRGVLFGESDFRMTADGVLVSTHNRVMSGDCGDVWRATSSSLESCTLKYRKHVATLADFLALSFKEWFVDLKDTDSDDEQRVIDAVDTAIAEVKRLGLTSQVVLMMYKAPPTVVDAIHKNGIRAGLKGYPKGRDAVMDMVQRAHDRQFEMLCITVGQLNEEIIASSARLGVWILAWDTNEDPKLWRELAEVGLGGVITRDIECVDRTATPFWQPVTL